MNLGIYYDMSWQDYRQIPYQSPSTLKHGLRSMKRLKRAIDGELQPECKTVIVGQIVHAIASGEKDRIAVMPRFELFDDNQTSNGRKSTSKTTTFYKDKKKAWEAENAGKDHATENDIIAARRAFASLNAAPGAKEILASYRKEVAVIGEIDGVMLKSRIDLLNAEHRAWADIKTTNDVEPKAFYRRQKALGTYFQLAFHCLLLANCGPQSFQPQKCDLIGVETEGDFDAGVVNVPFALLDAWQEKVRSVVEQYRQAKSTGIWPGMYPCERPLMIPEWDMTDAVFEG